MCGRGNTGGFSLVELVVVITILSILSAVAFTGYAGYLSRARGKTAEAFLRKLERELMLANAMAGPIRRIEIGMIDNKTLTVRVEADVFAEDFMDNVRQSVPNVADLVPDDLKNMTACSFYITAPAGWAECEYGQAEKIILQDQNILLAGEP